MKTTLLDAKGRSEEQFLKEYKPKQYEKPSLTVDVLIISDTLPMKLLLIRRKNHPFIEQWALPGGFVNMDESLEEGALRELKEETGVDAISIQQLHTYGDVHRDPRMRVISIAYIAQVHKEIEAHASDDANDAQWFTITKDAHYLSLTHEDIQIRYNITNDVPVVCPDVDALAFDHIQIILDGLQVIEKEN